MVATHIRTDDHTRAFRVALPPGYRADGPLRYLGRDPSSPTERAGGGHAVKAALLGGVPARLEIEVAGGAARCRIVARRAMPARAEAEARTLAARVLGLTLDPAPFERQVGRDPRVRPLIRGRRGLRMPLNGSVFEALCWSIIGQQVNLAFAAVLRREVIAMAGEDAGDGWKTHPTPAAVAALEPADLARRRFSRRKAEYLVDAARLVAAGALDLEALGRPPEEHGQTGTEGGPGGEAGDATGTNSADEPGAGAEAGLLAVRGIGPWSANYVLMRGCGMPDRVPVGDSGLAEALRRFFRLQARPDGATTRALMKPFTPWRSLATHHLWLSLGDEP